MAKRLLLRLGLGALILVALLPAIQLFKLQQVFTGHEVGWPFFAGELVSLFLIAVALDVSAKGKARRSVALLWLAGSAMLMGIAFVQLPRVRQRVAEENLARLESAGERQIRQCGEVLPPLRAKIDAAKLHRDAVAREFSDPKNAYGARFESRVSIAGAIACALVSAVQAVLSKERGA